MEHLVPELQRRGLFRTEYEGATLRENLGLAVPESRYALAREQAAEAEAKTDGDAVIPASGLVAA